jgi:general secretion pathway protein A
LAQRITSRTHLDPLTADESITYIKHRLSFAGATTDIFTKDALKALVKSSKGIPRLINVIADRALLGAFAHDAHQVTADIVYQAAEEVHGIVTTAPMTKWVVAVATFVIMMALGVLTYPVIHHVVMPDKTRLKDSSTDSLGTFLSTHSSMTGTDTAFQTLFGLWNLRFVPNDQKPCQQAAQQNLQCVADRGTIAQIKRINRPVILSLIDAHSNEYQVVVTHLTNDTVTLAAGSASIAIKAEDLLPFWYGDFLLLWHPPVSDLKNISPGQKGLEILWLRQAVAAALHIPPKGTNDVYDKSLEKDIEAFQKLNHLNVDGIVGPETQMLLDAALDSPQVPHLLSEAQ